MVPFISPARLLRVRRVLLISSLDGVVGCCASVMCPFVQLMFGLCFLSHVRPMIALSFPMFVTVNGICSVCSPMVSFSEA